jgi:hypothetical protein
MAPRVPGEDLVRAVAREHDLDVFAREAGEAVHREAGGHPEWLVGPGRPVLEGTQIAGTYHDFVMRRTQRLRDPARRRAFVERAVAGEAHGEGMQRGTHRLAGFEGHRRGVEAAAEERSHRHVRDQVGADGGAHPLT